MSEKNDKNNPLLKKRIKSDFDGTIRMRDIKISYLFVSDNVPDAFSIEIDSRVKSIEVKDIEDELQTKGLVYTAKLTDIVKIYDKVGDAIFEKNVRYGISDELNLDEEIRNTLVNTPQNFWFYSNGITLVIEKEKFNNYKSDSITLEAGKGGLISIINGAQTINSVSRFLSDTTIEKEIIERAKMQAKVMLRVMLIGEASEDKKEVMSNISVALNRQKSIKQVDITYMGELIEKMNVVLEETEEEYTFEILKRGEGRTSVRSYELVQLVRIIKAYMYQQPGGARSQSEKVLLKVRQSSSEDKKYAVLKDWKTEEEFWSYYKPVNFAADLLLAFKNIKTEHKDEKHLAVLKYGHYHFMAFIIWVLNAKDNQDFTNFSHQIPQCPKETSELIELFVKVGSNITGADILDSNGYKNDEMLDIMKRDCELYEIRSLCDKIKEVFK